MVFAGPLRVLALVLVRCPLYGQTLSVTDTAVAVDLDKSLDVHRDLTAKVTFNRVVVFDFVTKLCDLVLGEILRAGIGIDAGICKDVLRSSVRPIP